MNGVKNLMGDAWKVDSEHSKKAFLEHFEQLYAEHRHITLSWSTGKQVTSKQKSAMHVYLRLLSEALNDAGLDMKKVLKEGVDIPWTEVSAKEHLWRPIQKAMTGKKSTKDPLRKDYVEIYETLNRLTSSKFDIYIPWPVKTLPGVQ